MPSETETEGKPPVPSMWRLGWLLFMQPIELHWLHQAWGLEGDPSLRSIQRAGALGSVVRTLMARYALLLLVIMPSTAVLAEIALTLSGVLGDTSGVRIGAWLGVSVGSAYVGAVGMARGVVFGLAISVAAGVAFSVEGVFGYGLAYGVAFGVTLGVAFAVTYGIAHGATYGVAGSLVRGVFFAIVGSLLFGMLSGVKVGVTYGVVFAVAFAVAGIRLPLWMAEAILTQWLAWRMRRRPDAAGRLSSWLPIRHDELIEVPLPGLRVCLIQVAEVDPALGTELIALSADSPGQHRIAQLALIELQARELERAARNRLFARAAGLDFPFLPTETDLESEPANVPFLAFQSAARDLIAGSTNQRQRRLALERARNSLESFRVTTAGASRPAPLARRLLPTAALWLDVIRDEADKLAREVAERPEVPAAFVAGPPLTPERADDRTLFKGRADIIRLIGHDLAPDRRGVLLVVGQRRMGKTSLCNWLPMYLGTGTTVVVSNFQPLSGDPHRETPHRRVLGDIARSTGASEPPESARWGDGLRWLEELDRTSTDRKILVVIDEVERVEDGIRAGWCSPDFLDFLRAAGDALRHIRFLLITAYPLHRLGPHWTDHLVSVTSRTISYLDEPDARELLTHPIPEFPDIYPEGGVDLIVEQTGRHPYLLQKVGDDLCRLLNSRGGLRSATRDELTEVFDGLIRDLPLFDEIWRSRTDDERSTLRRLAESDEPGDRDPAAIQLEREGYLERRGDKVAIVIPLFREWIRTNVI